MNSASFYLSYCIGTTLLAIILTGLSFTFLKNLKDKDNRLIFSSLISVIILAIAGGVQQSPADLIFLSLMSQLTATGFLFYFAKR